MVKADKTTAFRQRNRIYVVQFISFVILMVVLFAQPMSSANSFIHEVCKMLGGILILACVFGRLWCILHISNNKNVKLITIGPYSTMRNPLYFFSMIGAMGIGLVFGSIILCLVLGMMIYFVFIFTGQKEADFLRQTFGSDYDDYAKKTPFFWPNITLYHNQENIEFSHRALVRTFIDSSYFLIAFPLLGFLQYCHIHGYLPTFFWIY